MTQSHAKAVRLTVHMYRLKYVLHVIAKQCSTCAADISTIFIVYFTTSYLLALLWYTNLALPVKSLTDTPCPS